MKKFEAKKEEHQMRADILSDPELLIPDPFDGYMENAQPRMTPPIDIITPPMPSTPIQPTANQIDTQMDLFPKYTQYSTVDDDYAIDVESPSSVLCSIDREDSDR